MFYIRFVITRLEDAPLCVMEIKIGAGPIGEMYMNYSEEVKVNNKLPMFHVTLLTVA